MPEMTPQQAEALARFLLTLRPDWSLQYAIPAVQNMRLIHPDVERIARAAIRGALSKTRGDWTMRKPDPLAMNGEHWKAQADMSSDPPRPSKCRDCHDWHAVGAECTPRRPAPRRESAIAELRAEHAKAKAGLCPHGVPPELCSDHDGKDHSTPRPEMTEERARQLLAAFVKHVTVGQEATE